MAIDIVGDLATLALLALTTMVPITLAALGEIVSERAGIVNIGLEGIMLAAAWIAVAVYLALDAGPLGGYIAGGILGAILGFLHGIVSVKLKGDQIVSGIGLNLAAAGATVLGTYALWGVFSNSPPVDPARGLAVVNGIKISFMVPLTIALGAALWTFLYKTVWGLRLRSCGEDPRSAEAMGVNVERYQIAASTFSGFLAGLAGAYLSVDRQGGFIKEMTAGRGFIALANVAFSGWNPLMALAGGYLFGLFEAIAVYINVAFEGLEPRYSILVNVIPYAATLTVVVVVARRRVKIPKWLGRPYVRE